MLFVHFANQAAEVVASLLLAPAHSPEPRLRLGHLHLLGEVGVDEGGEVRLVTEEGRLGRAEHPLELVAALKGVVQAVLAVRAVIPALLVIKNAAAVPSQPGRQHQGVSAPVLTESQGLGWAQVDRDARISVHKRGTAGIETAPRTVAAAFFQKGLCRLVSDRRAITYLGLGITVRQSPV